MNPDPTSVQLFELADEIERTLTEHAAPMPDPDAVRRLKFIETRLGGLDSYAAEKAGQIREAAERFYSVRKHQSHPGGADGLYTKMRHSLLPRIRTQARNRQSRGD